MVCYLGRLGRVVSQPGHIAEGGKEPGLSTETLDKEAQNYEVSLSPSSKHVHQDLHLHSSNHIRRKT